MRTLDVFYQSWTKRWFRKKWTELLSCGMEALSIFYFQGKASKLHFDSLDTHSRRKCGRFPKEGSAPYSQFKGNHGFLRQHLVFTAQKMRYCPVCKAICFYRVPISKPDDLCCVVLKINLNLAPFAVAVCLVFVDCGGDFLFALGLGFLFQPDSMNSTFGNQKFPVISGVFDCSVLCGKD